MRINSKIIIGATILLAIVVAGTVWATRSSAPVPEYQNRVTIPGSQTMPVSLWLEPAPARVGANTLTIQIADSTGSPIPVESVSLYIYPQGEFPQAALPATYTSEAPIHDFLGTGHGYQTAFAFANSGIWNVEVHFTAAPGSGSTVFEVDVSQ